MKWARRNSQKIGIVVISILDDDANLLASMNAGASGFISKTSPLDEIISAIHSAYKSPLSFTSKGLVRAINSRLFRATLTGRESEILALLPSGLNGAKMAKALFITGLPTKDFPLTSTSFTRDDSIRKPKTPELRRWRFWAAV